VPPANRSAAGGYDDCDAPAGNRFNWSAELATSELRLAGSVAKVPLGL
jgi:hypothetical protein